MLLRKTVVGGGFKLGAKPGSFEATIATLNVRDHDGDVLLPGSFIPGETVKVSSWNHDMGELPAGKGLIGANNERAWVTGEFFLNTTRGKETYETVKSLGDSCEWSFAYNILKARPGRLDGASVQFIDKLSCYEASPVTRGAGIGTRTEAIKTGGRYGDGGSAEGERIARELLSLSFDAGLNRSPKAARAAIAELERESVGSKGGRSVLAARVAIELLELEVDAIGTSVRRRRKSADGPPPPYVRIVNVCREAGLPEALAGFHCRVAACNLADEYEREYGMLRAGAERLADAVLSGHGEDVKRHAREAGSAQFETLNPHPAVYAGVLGHV